MKVQGTLIEKFETVQVTDNFKKRDVVVETIEQYPQLLLIQFTKDKCDVLNNYNLGDVVEIDINLRGREWVNPEGVKKYFNTIAGWKISKIEQAEVIDVITEEDDSMPF